MVYLRALFLALVMSFPAIGLAADPVSSAPDFVLKSLDGENLRLSEYRGQIVVMNFWASWCGRCRDQLPSLENLHERYGDSGMQILSVNLDGDIEKARQVKPRFPTQLSGVT